MLDSISILWKYFKEQDWKLGIPAFLFLYLFGDYLFLLPYSFRHEHLLSWQFFCATGFLIIYSLKFARKYNNLLIDQLKLVFYFLYFTLTILLMEESRYQYAFAYSLLIFLFYLYLHSIFIFYTNEMEAQGKSIRKSFLYSIVVIQSVLAVGVAVWGLTQKVEAEKQRELALRAKADAKKSEDSAEKLKGYAEEAKMEAIKMREEAEKAKDEYEQLLRQKK